MQSYYLHNQSSPSSKLKCLQCYRVNGQEEVVIGARGTQLQMYRLLDDDLAYCDRFVFYADIEKIQVLPSRFHQHDYVWILDKKGRFCFWHPNSIDFANNLILWQTQQVNLTVFSGVKYEFEDRRTEGNIFYCRGQVFVLLKFTINHKGIAIDQNNIIKYTPQHEHIRFMDWIQHSQDLFLIGAIVEEEQRTTLYVYDLEKGLGLSSEALQWKFQKTNLLQFYSVVNGELLILTYNQISLHNYRSNYPLKSYRTRGNYGQGFYLEEGLYGHIGEELITFNRDKLTSYGKVKIENLASFSSICLVKCTEVGKISNGAALILQTYQGDVYLLRLFAKTFTVYRLFESIGTILEICSVSKSQSFLAVVSQSLSNYEVSLLQRQYRMPIREQTQLQGYVQRMLTVNGGIYIIICYQHQNEVFRLITRTKQYQSYFLLPEGNILAADAQFIVYQHGVYEIDYQCFALTLLQEISILLAEITGEIVYFLDCSGFLHVFDNAEDSSIIVSTGRQQDYCWGTMKKSNTLLTANLKEPKIVKIISKRDNKSISIKGHTLVSSLSSLSYKKSRYDSDDRILVGYTDGQIHMHHMKNDTFYSTYVFETIGSMPVSFYACGQDKVLANFTTKQYLISAAQGQYDIKRVCCSNYNSFTYIFAFINKTEELGFIDRNNIMKKMSLSSIVGKNNQEQSIILKAVKVEKHNKSIPLLLRLNQRLIAAGRHCISLYNLQTVKPIYNFRHGLQQIICLSQIKMGIILVGVEQSKEYIIVLSHQLQLICRFELHSNKPIRCLRVLEGQNQFILAYNEYLTLYKITDSLQLISLLGSKIHMEAFHLDVYRNNILISDPSKSLSIFQYNQTITSLASHLPPYAIAHTIFIDKDVLYADERGSISVFTAQMEQQIQLVFKINKIFTINTGSIISAIYRAGECVYYAGQDGKIGTVQQISRDQFDFYKKIQTEVSLEMDQIADFNYWQWRNKIPAHERIIDAQMLGDKIYSYEEQKE